MLLSECARIVPMTVRRDASFRVPGLLVDPQPEMLAFVESRRYLTALRRLPDISCVIAAEGLADALDFVPGLAISRVPRRAFFDLHNFLARHSEVHGKRFATEVDPTARIHPQACVDPWNVRIGPETEVQAKAAILEGSTLSARVVVHAGAVVGGIGLQTSRFADGVVDLIHAGRVLVEDDVHILSQAVVARAVMGTPTVIGAGCRIGNHAFVSHSVQIGPRTFIGHGAVVNGYVTIGPDSWIGPVAAISNGVRVGAAARISLGAIVVRNVRAGQWVSGNFAMDHRRFLRRLAAME